MKKRKMLIFTMLALLVMSMSSCVLESIVETNSWRYIDEDEGFSRIEVNGVIYTQKDKNEWTPTHTSDYVRLVDDIYVYEDEINHIFVLLWEDSRSPNGAQLYKKEDFILPPFDSDNVDEICFMFPSHQIIDENTYYSKQRDLQIIDNVLEVWSQKKKTDSNKYNEISSENRMKLVGELLFYNDDLQGIDVSRSIYAMGEEYWMFFSGVYYYVKIPKELLSELTGIIMPEAETFSQFTVEEIYDFYGVDLN